MRPTIAITTGDPNGIGPEVTLKALANPALRSQARFILVGPKRLFLRHSGTVPLFGLQDTREVTSVTGSDEDIIFHTPKKLVNLKSPLPSGINREAGYVAGCAIEAAVELVKEGVIDALVTAPISKEALGAADFKYTAHTEFLAHRFGAKVVMILMSGRFRVALATTHCPLSEVSQRLTVDGLVRMLTIIQEDLKTRHGISLPHIAVAGLNPHAGENGLFGNEEVEIIKPAIEAAKALGILVQGPFSADTLFCDVNNKPFDIYLAMYHDQGLIPLKMSSFGRGVNYTAGLPFIRTSPDHGTAFDIAGKGLANSGSMEEAIKIAIKLAKKKRTS